MFRRLKAGVLLALLLALLLTASCRVDTNPQSQPAPAPVAPKSGLAYQSQDTQRLQADAFANPGMLAVDAGERLWSTAPNGSNQACADCHASAADELQPPLQPVRGMALQYPKVAAHNGRLENLEQRINRCRSEQQQQAPLAYESDELLALTAYVAHQSSGLPITTKVEPEAQAYFEAGKRYYYDRRGQMNLACHHCHELNAGQQLRGDLLSQGHGNGYPAYRLEWQTIGSLQRRLRFCNAGVRAEPHPYGAQEYVNLELFLRWRAAGLTVETPAVRR